MESIPLFIREPRQQENPRHNKPRSSEPPAVENHGQQKEREDKPPPVFPILPPKEPPPTSRSGGSYSNHRMKEIHKNIDCRKKKQARKRRHRPAPGKQAIFVADKDGVMTAVLEDDAGDPIVGGGKEDSDDVMMMVQPKRGVERWLNVG